MKARFLRFAGARSRARRASTLGLFMTLFASGTGYAQGHAEQHRARKPDADRPAGQIPGTITLGLPCTKANPDGARRAERAGD